MNKSKFVIPEFKDMTAERSHRIEDMRQKVQQLELLRSGMKDLEDNNNRLEPMIAQAEKTLAAKREAFDLMKKSKLVQETGAQLKPKMQSIASSCKAHTSRMSQITVKCGEISMIGTKLAEKQTLFKSKMAETRSSLIDRRNQIARQRTEILRDFKTDSDAKKQQISEIQSRIASAKLELESHGGDFAALDKRMFLLGAEKAVLEQDGNVLADNLIVRTEHYQTMEKNRDDLKEKIRVSNEMLLQAEMEKSNLEVRKQSLIEETGHMETQKLEKYSLQNLIEESKVEFEKLKQSILERESVNSDLIEQLKQLNNECNAKSSELNEVVKEFAGVKNECELAEVKHMELYSEVEQEQRNTATLESEMEILVKQKSNLVTEIERLNDLKIENEKNEILLLQEEQRLEIEIPNIDQDIKNQQVICDELFAKVKSSENEIKMKFEQLNAIKLNHYDGVSALEAEHFVEMGKMNSKVEQMNDQIAIRINESSENSKTLTNKRSELARLEKDVENAEIELTKLEQLDETLGAEFEHSKKTNSDELELLKKINEPIIDEIQKEIENLNQYVKDKQRELDEKQDYETSCQELSLEIETIERKLEIANDERDQLNADIELGHFIQGNAVSNDPRDCVSHQKVVIGDSESDITLSTIGGRSPVGIRERSRNIIPLVSARKVTTPVYAPPKTPNSGLNFQNLTLREKDDDDSSIMIIDEITTPVAKNRLGAMKIHKNEIIKKTPTKTTRINKNEAFKKTPTKTPIYGTPKLDFGLIRPTPKEQSVTIRNPPSKTPISPKSALKSPKSTKVSGSVKRVEFLLPDEKEPIKRTPVLSTPLKSASTVIELDIRTPSDRGEMPTTSRVGNKSNTGMLMSRLMRDSDKRKNNNKTPTIGGGIIKRLKPSSTFKKSALNKSENKKSSTDFDDIFNLDE